MIGRIVSVARVSVDPPATPSRKIRYRIDLACGCWWWEDYDVGVRPEIATASCYASEHGAPVRVSMLMPSIRPQPGGAAAVQRPAPHGPDAA
jgi:hypothetical protein